MMHGEGHGAADGARVVALERQVADQQRRIELLERQVAALVAAAENASTRTHNGADVSDARAADGGRGSALESESLIRLTSAVEDKLRMSEGNARDMLRSRR